MPESDLNMPPMTSDAPPAAGVTNPLKAPEEDGGSKMLSLTPEQLTSLGLEDCQPGDTYTINLTKTDSGEGEASFEVNSVDEGDGDGDEGQAAPMGEPPGGDEGEAPGALGASPDDMAVTPPGPPSGGSDETEGGEKMIGYKRKKKPSREGLPDTKSMRNL